MACGDRALGALAAAGEVLAFHLADEFVLRRFPCFLPRLNRTDLQGVWAEHAPKAAAAVLAAWSVMALAGTWRPRPGWRDRLGRLVGWLWLFDLVWNRYAASLVGRWLE